MHHLFSKTLSFLSLVCIIVQYVRILSDIGLRLFFLLYLHVANKVLIICKTDGDSFLLYLKS